MNWLWPGFLLLLGLIPLLVVAYILILRRRRRFAVRYSSLVLVRDGLPQSSRLRRHLPFALFLLGLVSLVTALGRPISIVSVPSDQTTIMLVLDVSGSMCQTDILPSRLEAAEAAAVMFVQSQKGATQIGLVAFSGFAELIQLPTSDPEVLETAIESLTTGRRTAIGSGILKALDAIAEIDPNVAPSVSSASTGIEPTAVPKGAYAPDIIVLLTDGVSNVGPSPLDAAQQALDRGVRVYTIGFGTETGASFKPGCGPGFQGGFGGGGFGGGGGFRRGIDDVTLKQVADMTRGTYYSAESAGDLQEAFRNLPTHLITKHEITEISVVSAALGVLLTALAVALSLLWNPLP